MNDQHFHDMCKYCSISHPLHTPDIDIFNNGCQLKFDLTLPDLSRTRHFFTFFSSRILSKDMNIAKLYIRLVVFIYPKQHGRCLRKSMETCSNDQLQRTLVMDVLWIHVLKIVQQNIAILQTPCIVFMLNFVQNNMEYNAEIEFNN